MAKIQLTESELRMPKIKITENKLNNLINECINEVVSESKVNSKPKEKVVLSESDLIKVIEESAMKILSTKKPINEAYKVNFKLMGEPKNHQSTDVTSQSVKQQMANGTFSGDRGLLSTYLTNLGYDRDQIVNGIRNGAITVGKVGKDGNFGEQGVRKQNRQEKRLYNKFGVRGSEVQRNNGATQVPTNEPAPAAEPAQQQVQTKTVYYKSQEIEQIQNILNEQYKAGLTPDGICGPLTVKAILNVLLVSYNTFKQNQQKREEIKANPLSQISADRINTPKVTTNTPQETIPRPEQTMGTANYQRSMSSVFNNTNLTPQQKIDNINKIVANAEKGGYQGGKELRDIADKYISALKSK